MPVYEAGSNTTGRSSIAAVAITVLALLGLAGGWVLLADTEHKGGHDVQVEVPPGR